MSHLPQVRVPSFPQKVIWSCKLRTVLGQELKRNKYFTLRDMLLYSVYKHRKIGGHSDSIVILDEQNFPIKNLCYQD